MRDSRRSSRVTLETAVAAPQPSRTVPENDTLAAVPAYRAVLGLFTAASPASSRDNLIRNFLAALLGRVEQRDERVDALNTLIERWPEARLRALPAEALVTWQLMVQQHVEAIRQHTEVLQASLGPLGTSTTSAQSERTAPTSYVTTFADAARTVSELDALVHLQDDALQQAFTVCDKEPCAPPDIDGLMRSFRMLGTAASRFDLFYLNTGSDPNERIPSP